MADKIANLYARIDADRKEKAEKILEKLGIPVSDAINMYYAQIIFHQGIPFEVKIPDWVLPEIGGYKTLYESRDRVEEILNSNDGEDAHFKDNEKLRAELGFPKKTEWEICEETAKYLKDLEPESLGIKPSDDSE